MPCLLAVSIFVSICIGLINFSTSIVLLLFVPNPYISKTLSVYLSSLVTFGPSYHDHITIFSLFVYFCIMYVSHLPSDCISQLFIHKHNKKVGCSPPPCVKPFLVAKASDLLLLMITLLTYSSNCLVLIVNKSFDLNSGYTKSVSYTHLIRC